MDPVLDPKSALNANGAITKRCSQLSLSLFKIASGLVDSFIPPAISAIAEDFAELAEISKELGELLAHNSSHKEELLNDAGRSLGRLDVLVRDFNDVISDFSPRRMIPRWFRDLFKSENISDLTCRCRSVKVPLRVNISVLKIALEEQKYEERNDEQRKGKKAKRKTNDSRDISALTRECEFAESWVEASRHVIKVLLNTERRLQKSSQQDIPKFRFWTETPGTTAVWIYNLIFSKTLKAQAEDKRSTSRWGRVSSNVRTINTEDVNGTASESELDEEALHFIPLDLERELYVHEVKQDVVNELLQRWTSADFQPIRQLTNPVRQKDVTEMEQSLTRIITWYNQNNDITAEHESPPPAYPHRRGRSMTRDRDSRSRDRGNDPNHTEWEVEEADDVRGKAPSPPVSPRETNEETRIEAKQGSERSSGRQETVPSRGRSPTHRKGDSSTKASSPRTNVPPPSKLESKKNIPIMVTPGDTIKTDGLQPLTIHIAKTDSEQQSSLKRSATEPKNGGGESSSRKQNDKRASNHASTSKVNFDVPRQKREEHANSDELASGSRHRDRRSSRHDPGSHRRDTASHTGVAGDRPFSRSHSRNTLPNPRHSPLRSSRPMLNVWTGPPVPRGSSSQNAFGMGANHLPILPVHVQQPAATMSTGPYASQAPSTHANGHVVGHQDQETRHEEGKNALLLQRLMDRLDRGEETRKNEEESRTLTDLKRALDEEKRSATLRKEVETLQMKVLKLRESALRDAEQWEEEKETLEKSLREQMESGERTPRQIDREETKSPRQREDTSQLYAIIERLQESESRKMQEWERERDKFLEAAGDQLERAVEAGEEDKQRAVQEAVQEYEGRLKVEQETARSATVRAEHYVDMYNGIIAARRAASARRAISTKASDAAYDPFNYYEGKQDSSAASLFDDEEETTVSGPLLDDQNPWVDKPTPYQRAVPLGRTRPYTASAATRSSDETSNIIIFPPRAGCNEFGRSQLGHYLASSGFKPMFEERERRWDNDREKIGSGGNVLRGTLFWQPPASTAEADLYKSLRNCGWKPTYVRTTDSGQTYFFGAQPVHAQFFSDTYKPQVTPFDISRASHGSEQESLIISKDLVEVEELDLLGHIYKEKENKIFLDPTMTPEDIDHVVARSFLAREGRYRKKFRKSHLRFAQAKVNVMEVGSEAGDNSSETSCGSNNKVVSFWSLWSPWS